MDWLPYSEKPQIPRRDTFRKAVCRFEYEYVRDFCVLCGNKRVAADLLEINLSSLYRILAKGAK